MNAIKDRCEITDLGGIKFLGENYLSSTDLRCEVLREANLSSKKQVTDFVEGKVKKEYLKAVKDVTNWNNTDWTHFGYFAAILKCKEEVVEYGFAAAANWYAEKFQISNSKQHPDYGVGFIAIPNRRGPRKGEQHSEQFFFDRLFAWLKLLSTKYDFRNTSYELKIRMVTEKPVCVGCTNRLKALSIYLATLGVTLKY